MWTAKKISADAAKKMQVESGLLLNKFSVEAPTEPPDQDIICETSGDYSFKCSPKTKDLFEDVNNAPDGTKEGKRITGWECGMTVTALSITEETLKLSLGAADGTAEAGIRGREQYVSEDFKSLYWIGDMLDETKLFLIVMENTVSTGGISFTASDDGKGKLSLNLMPHTTLADPHKVPMAFYILTKQEAA